MITHSSVSCSGVPVTGQTVTSASAATVTIGADASKPLAAQVVMGSTNNRLATFLLRETTNVEPVGITTITALDTTSVVTSKQAFVAVRLVCKLVNGSTSGCANYPSVTGVAAASSTNFTYTFNPDASVWKIPQNSSLVVDLVGDVVGSGSGGDPSADGSVHTFTIPGNLNLMSLTGAPNVAITPVVSGATGNAMTVVGGKLLLSAAQTVTGNQARTIQNVANLTFNAAQPGSDVQVNSIALKFQGSAVSGSFNVRLMQGGADFAGTTVQSCVSVGNTCTVVFTFSPAPNVSAGNSVTIQVNVDATGFIGAVSNGQTSGVAQITVNATGDVNWNDTIAPTIFQGLEASVVPLQVATVIYQ
jgi:hypothetical protein